MPRWTLWMILLGLTGCFQLPQLAADPPGNAPAQGSSPSGQTQTDCSRHPKDALEKRRIQSLSLGQQAQTATGQVQAGQQVGYTFAGKAGQHFVFKTGDAVCVQVYTPSNQLLTSPKLTETGTYIVQVFVPQGSTSFKLDMRLGDELTAQQPVSPSPSSMIASEPPGSSSASRSTNPDATTSSPPRHQESPSPSTAQLETPAARSSKPPKSAPRSQERQDPMDAIADRILNQRYPSLGGRKLTSADQDLIQEWEAIRACDAVVDYEFHQRHPELGGRNIQPDETALRNEWWRIHSGVSGCS